MGPEHELSIVDEDLKALPISDKVIKAFCGKTINFIEQPRFTFGKELQMHVLEVKANEPFKSPMVFEETMQDAVTSIRVFLHRNYRANLLGTGMHPFLRLEETGIWPHRHKKIYDELGKIFNLRQHGWLNIQSFHLNLPYSNEKKAVALHNNLALLSAYLPAISASSPIYEGKIGSAVDNRLLFYKENQREVPAVTGDVVPEYASSFKQYRQEVIGGYSRDLGAIGAGETILQKEWVNSRGVIFRFDRAALEVRVIDEQECVKSDVALSCFVRGALRGLMTGEDTPLQHKLLVNDFNAVVQAGLDAKVQHPAGATAKRVCLHFFEIAAENADDDEKKFLWLIKKRIENGSLSEIIRERVTRKAQKTDLEEAIRSIYSSLIKCLVDNQPYF